MFEELKEKWDKGYISIETLKGWVRLYEKKGKGITREQFEEITGLPYEDEEN